MKLLSVYDCVEIISDTKVRVDNMIYPAKVGKHSIWIPELNMKFPFHYNGHFVEYKHWDRGQHAESIYKHKFGALDLSFSRESMFNIVEEYMLFDLLSKKDMSPKVNGFFYIRSLISNFFGGKYCDPKGAYGYYMEDAAKLKETEFDFHAFRREFIKTDLIVCSDTALGDILEPSRNNHINGRIVDIRRSIQDAVHLNMNTNNGENIIWNIVEEIQHNEDAGNLKRQVQELGQFPFKDRSQPYQSYYLGKELIKGTRDIQYRFKKFEIPEDLKGKTVLDLGCCLGAVCQFAYMRGARGILGIDYQQEREYIHVFVHRLRNKIESESVDPKRILTVPGVGYQFKN